jgi:predicted transcriptional regulator
VEKFDLAEIDMQHSLKNQARLVEPISEDLVTQYAADMTHGDEFPPIVVWRNKDTYIVVSGIHRTLAAMAAQTSLSAFVLTDTDQRAISVLTYEANATHGRSTTTAERIQQALFLVDGGLTQSEAGRLLHVSQKMISRYVQIRRGRDRLKLAGFRRPDRLADSSVQRLESLRSDEVLLKAANLCRDASLGTEKVGSLVTELMKERTDAGQLTLIERERKTLKPTISAKMGGTVKLPRSVERLEKVATAATKLIVPTRVEVSNLPLEYRKQLAETTKLALTQLATISAGLK